MFDIPPVLCIVSGVKRSADGWNAQKEGGGGEKLEGARGGEEDATASIRHAQQRRSASKRRVHRPKSTWLGSLETHQGQTLPQRGVREQIPQLADAGAMLRWPSSPVDYRER